MSDRSDGRGGGPKEVLAVEEVVEKVRWDWKEGLLETGALQGIVGVPFRVGLEARFGDEVVGTVMAVRGVCSDICVVVEGLVWAGAGVVGKTGSGGSEGNGGGDSDDDDCPGC